MQRYLDKHARRLIKEMLAHADYKPSLLLLAQEICSKVELTFPTPFNLGQGPHAATMNALAEYGLLKRTFRAGILGSTISLEHTDTLRRHLRAHPEIKPHLRDTTKPRDRANDGAPRLRG